MAVRVPLECSVLTYKYKKYLCHIYSDRTQYIYNTDHTDGKINLIFTHVVEL